MKSRHPIKINRFKTFKTQHLEDHLHTALREDNKVIIFQEEIKTIKNYFTFMKNVFGNKQKADQSIKNSPQKIAFEKEAMFQQHKSERGKSLNNEQKWDLFNKTTRLTTQNDKKKVTKMYNNMLTKTLLKSKKRTLGQIIKGTTKSRHSFMMSKLQNSRNTQSPQHLIQKINNTQNIEQFVPMGKIQNKLQKYQMLGLTNITEKNLSKLEKTIFQKKRNKKKQLILISEPSLISRPSTAIRTIHTKIYSSLHKNHQRKSFMQAVQAKDPPRIHHSLFTPWDVSLRSG